MSRNRVVGAFEDTFESGKSSVATAIKQTAKDFTTSAKGQITGGSTSASLPHQSPASSHGKSDHGTNEHGAGNQNSQQATDPKTDEERKQFLRDLYGGGGHGEKSNSHSDSSKTGVVKQALGIFDDPNKGLSPEEIAKLTALRNQLHSNYYRDLITPQQREVSVTEKLEREDQMEKIDAFEKQKKKPNPLQNVKQGTGESVVGASG